ncbi:globin domain-containing protein [Streptomyces sp. NPDC001914]|uniref:globin domain-containing protein n=1 Tax=Streptomyces sp. NPDC001914 TaxID=3364623 RepID=UPI00368B0970
MDPEILRSSFAVVERRAEFAVKYFYSHLFRHNPQLRALFPADLAQDMERQRDRLFAALTFVMDNLENPDLPRYLRSLGRDHRKYLTRPEHYAAVGESLLAAFAVVSGSAWSAEAEKAWTAAYGSIARSMLEGAWKARHHGEPPWWDAEVVSRTRHGDDLVVLTVRPRQRLTYSPGQYVGVSAPHLPRVWRPYSLANAPRTDRTVDLHVSRVEDGVLSTALVRRTRVGDVLRLGPPGGGLTLRTPADRPLTLIAAGTGWAPVKALLEQLEPAHEARLFLVARDIAHLYDRTAVERLRAALPGLTVTYITPAPGRPKAQATERLLTALGNRAGWTRHDVYVAGPPVLVEEVGDALTSLGTPAERVFHDPLPPTGEGRPRPVGAAQWLLDRPPPAWHNPTGRTPGH